MAKKTKAIPQEPRREEQREDRQDTSRGILLHHVRVNNLKNIDLEIPRGKLIVVTGVSGSGKSSLAFDTLYAEGQRRYVESLSSYARQFVGRMAKPEADWIRGLPPAIAIEQRVVSRNPRSTVATSTEIYEYLRLLYARVGKTISPISGQEVRKHTVQDVLDYAKSLPVGSRIYLIVPLHLPKGRSLAEHLEIQLQQGYSRLWTSEGIIPIEDALLWKDDRAGEVSLLIDRLAISEDQSAIDRLGDSVETAFFEGRGECQLAVEEQRGDGRAPAYLKTFSNVFEADGRVFQEPSPEMFSFNNPIGACPECEGFGKVVGVDPRLVIPDPTRSVYDDAVACWRGVVSSEWKQFFIRYAERAKFPIHRPYEELTKEQKAQLWDGIPSKEYGPIGITPYFDFLRGNLYKIQNRVRLAHFTGKTICPTCHGGRLKPDALCVQVGGKNIAEIVAMTLWEAQHFFDTLELSPAEELIAKRLLHEIRSRLGFLVEVGLGYLTLDRLSNSLSGGESQRVTLATQLGSSLVGSLYVLDEPSIGLHQRDTARLIQVVKRLRDLGNTVVVVEHDEEMMRAADYIIDIGPDAGRYGGEVVYAGEASEITSDTPGYTAAYLTGREQIALPTVRRPWKDYLELEGATMHNLKDITVRFPLHTLTVVSGVSGSGKSTLMHDLLYEAVRRTLEREPMDNLELRALRGDLGEIKQIEYVDQNNIGRSSRSNPVTYVGAFDSIRDLYAGLPLSKQMGYKPYYFSFNKEGGRCETCQGAGVITIEMQFMADLTLPCEACHGTRFRKELLEVEYCGVNISQLLDMSVDEAVEFFDQNRESSTLSAKIIDQLRPLQRVGLGYIKLGQNGSTLSGGENQRVKLAYYLGKGKKLPTLFIFDEPTTGLHFHDIRTLLSALQALVEQGHSVIVVEHNLEVIKCADWVIDLGPEGGASGGYIVAEGTPEQVASTPSSVTGQYLRELLLPQSK